MRNDLTIGLCDFMTSEQLLSMSLINGLIESCAVENDIAEKSNLVCTFYVAYSPNEAILFFFVTGTEWSGKE